MTVPASLPARTEFPIIANDANLVYLNASFQMPLSKSSRDAAVAQLDSQMNDKAPKAAWFDTVAETRKKVANFINSPTESVAFVKNTSDGLNIFIRSLQWEKGANVVILDGEHPNQSYAWLALEEQGLEVRRIPTPNFANSDTFKPVVDEKTICVGISWVMFHSGQKNDVPGICKHFRPLGVHVLVDGTQTLGWVPVDVREARPSALAFGCHKGMNTPAGLAVLYVDPDLVPHITPPMVALQSVANMPSSLIVATPLKYVGNASKFEGGNANYMAVHALGGYLSLLERIGGIQVVETYLYGLADRLIEGMAALGVTTVASTDRARRSPHNIVFPLLDPKWLMFLSSKGIQISQYRAGVRVSLGIYNNTADIDRFLLAMKEGSLSIQLA
ncbi:PLP-dependent transferase [Meredithblackwellia eburnea MCA 4105]